MTSTQPGIDPDQLAPAERARMFFDHGAQVVDGRVKLEHRGLAKEWTLGQADAERLEELVSTTDWQRLAQATAAEAPQEGGTVFRFEVAVGDDTFVLTSGNLDAHPRLLEIVALLRQVSGIP